MFALDIPKINALETMSPAPKKATVRSAPWPSKTYAFTVPSTIK